MNMKSLIALTALTAAGAASAAVTSENTLCRIEINSGTKNTIVAVPLVKVGDGTEISADKLVLPDNLTSNDKLVHWNATSGKWESWVISNGAWQPVTISEEGSTYVTPDVNGVSLTRGDAVWVERADVNKPFYIYGQVTATAATSTAIAGTKDSPVYTMMGNASLGAVALNKEGLWPTSGNNKVVAGDTIAVAASNAFGRKEYTYVDNKGWCTIGRENGVRTWVSTTDTIDAGCGFWYISRGGNPTVNW